MAKYGWIIDKDIICCGDDEGVIGPRDISLEHQEMLKNTKQGEKFKMYDDDGELYYEGRIVGEDYLQLEPLVDFGMGNAGCTEIRYKNKTGEWESV